MDRRRGRRMGCFAHPFLESIQSCDGSPYTRDTRSDGSGTSGLVWPERMRSINGRLANAPGLSMAFIAASPDRGRHQHCDWIMRTQRMRGQFVEECIGEWIQWK